MLGRSISSEGLPLGLEAGQDCPGIHAGLGELDGHQALDRLALLRHPDGAHSAFADRLQQLVAAGDDGGDLLASGGWASVGSPDGGRRRLQKAARLRVGLEYARRVGAGPGRPGRPNRGRRRASWGEPFSRAAMKISSTRDGLITALLLPVGPHPSMRGFGVKPLTSFCRGLRSSDYPWAGASPPSSA